MFYVTISGNIHLLIDRAIKRVRFMDGYKTEYISRNDFVSDDTWNKFLKFQAYKKSKLVVAYNKNLRNKKNIKNL